jgi:hypothetical protein
VYGCGMGLLAYMILSLFIRVTGKDHELLWYICAIMLSNTLLAFFIFRKKVTSSKDLWLRRAVYSIALCIITPLLAIIVLSEEEYINNYPGMFLYCTVYILIIFAVYYPLYDLYIRYTVKKINKKLMMNNKENNEK